MKDTYTKNKVLAGMQLLKKPVPSIILNQSAPNPVKLREDQSVLDRIFERGVIRMGFHPDALPFGYINDQGDLVGLDIELAHELAKQLGVKIEFVPVEIESLSQQLEEDHIDIVMAGLPVVLSGRTNILYSDAYIDLTPAIAVPDYRRHDFSDMDRIKSMESLKLYILDVEYLKDRIRTALPKAHLVAIDSPRDFFEGSRQHVDALLIAAERGSAWTLLYPQYTVLIPWTEDIRWPAAYPIGGQDMALASLVNRWIELIKKDGTLKEAYDYWILGKNTEPRQPRWNIMRDVLHWVE